MNRQIWGIALFLIIVKSTFLLYWGFFAPNNVYVTETNVSTPSETVVVRNKNACKLQAPSVKPKLQSVVMNTKTGKLTVSFSEAITKSEINNLRLIISDEIGSYYWLSESSKFNEIFNEVGTIDFDKPRVSHNFETTLSKTQLNTIKLNRSNNYYAFVDDLSRLDSLNDHHSFNPNDATPVLLNYGK